MRGIHHLALEGERVDAAPRVFLERRDQLASFRDGLLRRREHLVDHGDLAWMDGDLAGETHRHAVLALPPPTSRRSTRSTRTSRTDRKSTRLNSSHVRISYAVFC